MKIFSKLPREGQLVNIIILNNDFKNNNYLKVKLVDYELDGIITISNLTLKKKIRNINKIAPINTVLPAFVDHVDKVISVSRLNIDTKSEIYKKFIDENESNKLVRSFVISSAIKTNKEQSFFLEKVVYVVDNKRKNGFLYDNILKKIDSIKLKKTIKKIIKPLLNKKEIKKTKLYKTNIGIIAKESLENTKKEINSILSKYKELQLKLIATPNYNIISDFCDMNKHNKFINDLEQLKNKSFNLKIY